MGFCRASLAGTSDATGPHGLGDGPFNASALGILGFVRLGLLTRPCGLQAQIVFVWSHRNGAPLGPGTLETAGARLAIARRDLHLEHRVAAAIHNRRPTATRLSHRTRGPLLFPSDDEVAGIDSLSRLGLPCVSGSCRAPPCHAVGALTGDQQCCIQVTGSDHMESWQQLFRVHLFMDRMGAFCLGNGPSCRVHLGDQLRWIVFTALCDVHCVAHPGRGVLCGIGRIEVIRRAKHPRGWGQPCGGGAPAGPCLGALAWLHPEAAPGLDGWDLTPPSWGILGLKGVQQGIASPAHGVGLGLAWLLALWHAGVVRAGAIARQPFRAAMRLQPSQCRYGQAVEGMPHRVGDTHHAVNRADGPQHMGGRGPLPAMAFQALAVTTTLPQGIQEPRFGLTRHQARATLAAHGAGQAGIGKLSPQGIRPIDPTPHGISGLPVGQALGIRQNGHQGQAPGCFSRAPAYRKHGRKGRVCKDRAKLIAQT
jgi:hypothetical protein